MNRLLIEELKRMKNLSLYERGRVISEQKRILSEQVDDATWQTAVNYLKSKNAVKAEGDGYVTTFNGVTVMKSGFWVNDTLASQGKSQDNQKWSIQNGVPVDDASKQPLDSNIASTVNITGEKTGTLQTSPEQTPIGETPSSQDEADKFKVWLKQNYPDFKCRVGNSKGMGISTTPGRPYQGPCMKDVWKQYGEDFRDTSNKNPMANSQGPSLEEVFLNVANQLPNKGFPTFIYASGDTGFTGIGSSKTYPELIKTFDSIGYDYSKFVNPAQTSPPPSGLFTKDYAANFKGMTIQTPGASTATTADTSVAVTSTASTASTVTAEIKTPEDAKKAIEAAETKAKELKAQVKMDKETCRTIGKAVNPVMPLKRGVTSPELCAKLHQCMDQGFLVRGDKAFADACPKPTTPPAT